MRTVRRLALAAVLLSILAVLASIAAGHVAEVWATGTQLAGPNRLNEVVRSTLAKLAYRLRPEMRAGTVTVDDAAGRLAGLIKPGDHIDVLLMGTSPEDGETTIKMLLQNTEVLAVGKRNSANSMEDESNAGKSQAQNYTLLLTNEQFQTLALATSRGKISRVVPGRNDSALADASELNLRGLFGLPNISSQPMNLPAPRGTRTQYEIEYIEGGEVRTEKIRLEAPRH